jgi:uncharacterized protein GlcG (DUF336 family)
VPSTRLIGITYDITKRKRAEAALQASRATAKALLNAHQISIIDAERSFRLFWRTRSSSRVSQTLANRSLLFIPRTSANLLRP